MPRRPTLYDPDRPDLDPSSQQPELYQELLNAIAGDFPSHRGSERRNGGRHDVVGWFLEQTWCPAEDWLFVAQFWGGDQLREKLAERIEKLGLVPA